MSRRFPLTSLLLLLLAPNAVCAFVVEGTARTSISSFSARLRYPSDVCPKSLSPRSRPNGGGRARGGGAGSLCIHTILSSQATSSAAAENNEPDFGEVAKYGLATGIQFSLLAGLLKLIDWMVSKAGTANAGGGGRLLPLPLVGVLFAFLSLRSRVASVLDNSRPNVEAQGGKATPNDVKRPSWTPPGAAFPIIWLSITLLRAVSSALVYRETGALYCVPLLSMILHLSIGDTWNTITNVEKRLGVSAVGCVVVWMSVWNAIIRYYDVVPLAGKVLSPSGMWITVATVLTMTIRRMNEPVQPAFPAKGDGKSASLKLSNLLQIQPTSIGGSKKS